MIGPGNYFVDFFISSGLPVILENGCQIHLSNDTVRTDLRICSVSDIDSLRFNTFKPEFTIVIFIHYKPRIAAAILDL